MTLPASKSRPPTTIPGVASTLVVRRRAPLVAEGGEDNKSLGFDLAVGRCAHRLVAEVLPVARDLSRGELVDVLSDAVGPVIATEKVLRARSAAARIRVTGLCSLYLMRFAPPSFVELVDTEMTVEAGRVDVAWRHPTAGVLFDELKTSRISVAPLDAHARAQAAGYAACAAAFDRFAGVRLLPLTNGPASRLFTPDGRCLPLSVTLLSPAVLAAEHEQLLANGGDLSALTSRRSA